MATINGSHGSDKITGTSNDDVLKGNAGNDVINGGKGNDNIQGGTGNDKLYGGDGDDKIYGGSGKDTLYGGEGDDNFVEYYNDSYELSEDYISGGAGNDYIEIPHDNIIGQIFGGSGDDYIQFNNTEDLNNKSIIHGGDDNDKIHISNDFLIDFNFILDGGTGYDVLEINSNQVFPDDNFQNHVLFQAKNFEEIILYGLDEDKSIYCNFTGENAFIDSFIDEGKTLNFKVNGYGDQGGDGNFAVLDFSAETDAFINFIMEDLGSANAKGGQKSDSFYGEGEGDDIFQGNGGNDYFFGDDGHNTAVFNGEKSQYLISEIGYNKYLIKDKVKGRDGTDTIENVNTLSFSDGDYDLVIKGLKIEGDGSAEVINGGKYSDYIDGGGGNDKLRGKNGNDTILGGIGNDAILGGNGNDQLNGGEGIDTVFFGGGDDEVKLFTPQKQNTIDGIGSGYNKSISKGFIKSKDTLIGIENVSAGSGNDKVYGSKGSNVLNGGTGDDLLVGGKGNDRLIGGKGKDIFKLSKGEGYDLIQDFENQKDKIFIGSANKLKLKNKGKDVNVYIGKDLIAKVKGAKGDLSLKGKYLV